MLVTGESFSDAICAAPLSKLLDAPILLTSGSSLSKAAEKELDRLKVKRVIIIGGTEVISENIDKRLKEKGIDFSRIYGTDKYSTSVEIAGYIAERVRGGEIIIVTDDNFVDAVSASSVAASKGIPVIMVPGSFPADYVNILKSYIINNRVSKTYIIGSSNIDRSMLSLPGSVEVLKGEDRYETNIAVIKRFQNELKLSIIYAASGSDYADMLAGSALAQKTSSPIILVSENPEQCTRDFINSRLSSINRITALGGEEVIPFTTLSYFVNGSMDVNSIYNDSSLRFDASFKVKVNNNVYWVPANVLGKPELSRIQISSLDRSPQFLRANINTLYDAIQYVRSSDLKSTEDSITTLENGLEWKHHKNGSKVISTNDGCSEDISNLVNYLLKDKYSEVGYIQYFQEDGSSHTFNYIKQDGKYYIFDLSKYRGDSRQNAVESGNTKDYYNSDYIAGNIHETSSLEDYIKYCKSNFNNPPEIWVSYTADNMPPVGRITDKEKENGSIVIYFPKYIKDSFNVIYDNPDDNISYDFTDGPVQVPAWNVVRLNNTIY